MILLPNLSIGNFASVVRMVQKVGGSARLTDSPDEIRTADKIILAGVGAFDNGMRSIHERCWADALTEAVTRRKAPVLGICLGMQLMCKASEEGNLPGLGWMDAEVKRFDASRDSTLKVPHMGWSTVNVARPNVLIPSGDAEQRFYFVHSYYATCTRPDDVLAVAQHGTEFVAAFGRDNLYGVQFHPEKSHRFGMEVMKRFVEL